MLWFKNKKDKEEKDDPKLLSKISSGKVKVKIFHPYGGSVPNLVGEFLAFQSRDASGRLSIINQSLKFDEDIDFERDDVFRELQVILEIKGNNKEKQLKILDSKITFQKKLIKYLDEHVKLNAVYNYADENLKLRSLKLLFNKIKKHDANGSFFSLENGLRTYSFVSKDGFFYPIWHGADDYSNYPDYVRKKKIHAEETKKFEEEWGHKFLKHAPTFGFGIVMVVLLLLTIAMGILVFKLVDKNAQIDERINAGISSCSKYQSLVLGNMNQFLDNNIVKEALDKADLTAEEFKKESGIIQLNPNSTG